MSSNAQVMLIAFHPVDSNPAEKVDDK